MLERGAPSYPCILILHFTDYFTHMRCVPATDVPAERPGTRLDAVVVEPRGGLDAAWLSVSSSGIGNAIPIALLSQAICSLVNGVAMSGGVAIVRNPAECAGLANSKHTKLVGYCLVLTSTVTDLHVPV